VLTRLPAPHRASGAIVREFLKARFSQPFLRLSAAAYKDFLSELPARVSGGAAYDALVAATVAHHDAELVSCDRRAAVIYERYQNSDAYFVEGQLRGPSQRREWHRQAGSTVEETPRDSRWTRRTASCRDPRHAPICIAEERAHD